MQVHREWLGRTDTELSAVATGGEGRSRSGAQRRSRGTPTLFDSADCSTEEFMSCITYVKNIEQLIRGKICHLA